jgi:serine/threonine protein kinase
MARPDNPIFGKYRWVADLGSGGMGDVFLAVAQGPAGFNKLQVIKRLRPELVQDREFFAMFLNEARIAARLNHPNVVQTNEVGEQEGEPYLAMEFLDGQSLYAIVRKAQNRPTRDGKAGRFPLAFHLHVLAEACAGLHYAHELTDFDGTPLALVHRDCSPQNVFVTYEGEVKVLDFGIAKARDSVTVTRTGAIKGKVPFMAPEQIDGRHVDRRADVFAIGTMLWEAATGTRLWRGLGDLQIVHRLQSGGIPRPRDFDPRCDPKLDAIVMKALEIDPEKRFPSCGELQAALDQYVVRLGGVRRRDFGRYVSVLFLETRREMRARIEAELRGVVPAWSQTTDALRALQTGEHRAVDASELSAILDGELDAIEDLATLDLEPVESTASRSGRTTVAPRRPPRNNAETPYEAIVPSHEGSLPQSTTQRSSIMELTAAASARGARGRAVLLAATVTFVFGALFVVVQRLRQSSGPEVAATGQAPEGGAPKNQPPARPSVEARVENAGGASSGATPEVDGPTTDPTTEPSVAPSVHRPPAVGSGKARPGHGSTRPPRLPLDLGDPWK